MARIRVRHLIEKPSGFYFRVTPAMRAVEFRPEPLGKDRAAAIARGAVIVDVYNPPSAALAKAAQGKRGAHRAREARPGRGARPSGGGAG